MFKDLTNFSSFIESAIALSFFLSAWDKPERIFSNLLNKTHLFTERLIDIPLKLFNTLLRSARWTSVLTISYGLVILFLSGLCDYENGSTICQYSITHNQFDSIIIHLLIVSLPILINAFIILLGIIYYAIVRLVFLIKPTMLKIKSYKSDKIKLTLVSKYSEQELKNILKNNELKPTT